MLGIGGLRHPLGARMIQTTFAAVVLCVLADFLSFISLFNNRQSTPNNSLSHTSSVQKIFISSTHWNNEHVLRSHWNQAIIDLVNQFGRDNVYVSILESGSWDDSKNALRDLNKTLDYLNVNRTIILDETTHLDEIQMPPAGSGWIDTPRGKRELRRIPFLSRLRNKTLEPLKVLIAEGHKLDKIVFLNDVVFSVSVDFRIRRTALKATDDHAQTTDFMTLLNTRQGQYAAVCSLDFKSPPRYYDTFALRDSNGKAAFSQHYPLLSSRASLRAFVSKDPVPVKSCWNGIGTLLTHPVSCSLAQLTVRTQPFSTQSPF